jgi:uncharacterized protein (DUF885 family)
MDLSARIDALPSAGPERARALFDLYWDWSMHQQPEDATAIGHPGQNGRWSDRSPEGAQRRREDLETIARAADGIEATELAPADALNAEVLSRQLEIKTQGNRFRDEYLGIGTMSGPQTLVPRVLGITPVATDEGREDFLTRLSAIPALLEGMRRTLDSGIDAGIVVPRAVLAGVPEQVAAQSTDDPDASPLLEALRGLGPEGDDARARAATILRDEVAPAFAAFGAFLSDTYVPAARETIALSDLPDGADWYAHRIRLYTTTDLSAQQIHDIGVSEVERISSEMEKVAVDAGFAGDLAGFRAHLRDADEFYFTDAEALLASYRDIAKRIDPALPRLFGVLPRQPYGVEPVPSYMEERTPTAYYMPGAREAGRAGNFYANTFALRSRPRWEMEALTLHEAVPGHHLQIALAQEIEGMPDFRRFGGFTAYIEGWGLYSEDLGDELGFYTEPASRYGKLAYEMWRAGRLVVDTGMHALGWSRQQAIDFLIEHTGKASHDIVVEVDRYIGWPGQALAYKIGELKLKELRARAKKVLGARFDIRAFHDGVLGGGALPLDVLERLIDAWIEEAQR